MRFLLLLLAICFQELLLNAGTIIQNTNVIITWDAPTNVFPKTIWTYRVIPTSFSDATISNLESIGEFSDKDRKDYGTNGVVFSAGGKNMRISFTEGEIDFTAPTRNFSATNLAIGVPNDNQLYQLATNTIGKTGINLMDISKDTNGDPKFFFTEMDASIPYSNSFITNVENRDVNFRRSLDGIEFFYNGGRGRISYGEHGKIISILIDWRNVERDKSYDSLTPEQIIKYIREGKASFGRAKGDVDIDWATIKSLTINDAVVNYFGELYRGQREHRSIFPSPIFPLVTLYATVDTGMYKYEVGIRCPAIDDDKH